MADDKWISGLRGDMPVPEAARLVLSVRVGGVLGRLPAPVDRAHEEVDHGQQLVGKSADSLSDASKSPELRELAVPMLEQLVREFEEAAGGDLHEYDALHQVRILGKQMRYAMELFESCFAPAFREEIYPCVVEMQDILGRANDSHVAGH